MTQLQMMYILRMVVSHGKQLNSLAVTNHIPIGIGFMAETFTTP